MIVIVNNAALLLALALLYDTLSLSPRYERLPLRQVGVGIALGTIGIAIMLNPWNVGHGMVLDSRSVLLCIAGFFFGTVPVVLAALMTAGLRFIMGGAGFWTGIAIIVSSGGIGLAWRHLRRDRPAIPSLKELYLLGLTVHAVMLACMLFLPWEVVDGVLWEITPPIMLVFPIATAVLGNLMVHRIKRQQMDLELRKSEEKFRNLFQNHAAAKLLVDAETGQIAEANEAAEKFYGWSASELKKLNIQDINTLPPEQIKREMYNTRTQKRIHFEFSHRLADTSIKHVDVYSSKIDIDGKAYLHSIIHDATNRKQTEIELREREQFLRLIIETTPDGFWVMDRQGWLTEVNDAYCTMSGYSLDEIIGMNISELDVVETPGETAERIQRIINNGSEIFETCHMRKGCSIFPVEISATYLNADGGKFVCFGRDLTDRKADQEAVAHSHDLMKYIIEHANSAVAVHDRDLQFIYVSKRYLDEYKVEEKDIIGKHHYEVFPDLPQKWRDVHKKALKGEVSGAERDSYPREDGTVGWTRWECRPWYESGGSIGGIIVYTEVITDWVLTEEALRESEEYQRAMIEASPVAIMSLTPDGLVKTWNTAAERMFGWCGEEVIGHFNPIVPNNQHQDFADLRRKVMSGESLSQIELTRIRKDGTQIHISLSTAPLRNKEGRVTGIMSILEDITKRRQAEEGQDKLQAQLIQAQKMESVGRLAGGVAHDYNNMLGVILGYTELAIEKIGPEDELREDLEEVLSAARRSTEITRQLLAFSRQQTITPEMLDLNETIEGMLKMLRRLIGEDINLFWQPRARKWRVYMDPSQIDQIMVNLCVNARDAITDVGKITIETETRSFDQDYCSENTGFVAGDYIMLSVSDDGCGMDKEIQSRLFEPFFSTKNTGKGTGLGLATVYGIVRQNDGFINVYSEPGNGTTFRIYLPRHENMKEDTKSHVLSEPEMKGNETILLVEDEQRILKMTTAMLEKLGYTVLSAQTPAEAIDTAKMQDIKIDLLMTDVVMPVMNGRELSEKIKTLHQNLKIMFMSGYTADLIAHRGVLDEGINFIQKPFAKRELAFKLRNILDE